MSYQQPSPELPSPEPSQQHVQPKRRHWPWIVAAVSGLVLGVGIGTAGGSETASTAEPETVTKTKTEEVVPQACLDALDYADRGFAYAARFSGLTVKVLDAAADSALAAADGMQAVANLDVAGIEDVTARVESATAQVTDVNGKMDTLNEKVEQTMPRYRAASDECRQ